jgi:prepilin-type N-terminal cleavage/methylation domain-containing protein
MNMRSKSFLNRNGVTLIELMVALVICGVVIGAIYRLFVAQTRAYTVQDQVAEVQQSVRGAMEILVRDLRMAGCETVAVPIVTPVQPDSITVNYQQSQVFYNLVGPLGNQNLERQLTLNGVLTPAEVILPNVNSFILTYGIDANGDGIVDDWDGSGVVDLGDYMPAASVGANRVISIRVQVSGNPSPNSPDAVAQVSPRTLDTVVTLRNLLP